jgi:hypothetical protein
MATWSDLRSRDHFGVPLGLRMRKPEGAQYSPQLSPAVRMSHVKALQMTSWKYLIRRIEVKVYTVPRGSMNYVQDNMFLGLI